MSKEREIKRYDIMSNAHDSWFAERENGNYVSFKDYKKLEQELKDSEEYNELISIDNFRLQQEKAELINAFEELLIEARNFYSQSLNRKTEEEYFKCDIELLQKYKEGE